MAPRFVIVEVAAPDGEDERFAVAALAEDAAALGLRVPRYRLLDGPPITWEAAEHMARELNGTAPRP